MSMFAGNSTSSLPKGPYFEILSLLDGKALIALSKTCKGCRESASLYAREELNKIVSNYNLIRGQGHDLKTMAKKVFGISASNAEKLILVYKKIQDIVSLSLVFYQESDPKVPMGAGIAPYYFYFSQKERIDKCLQEEWDLFLKVLKGDEGPFAGLTEFVDRTPLLEHFDKDWNLIDPLFFLSDVKKYIGYCNKLFRSIYPEKIDEIEASCTNIYKRHFKAHSNLDKGRLQKDCLAKIMQILKARLTNSSDVQCLQGALFLQVLDPRYYPQIAQFAIERRLDDVIEILIKCDFEFEKSQKKKMQHSQRKLIKEKCATKVSRGDSREVVKTECESIEVSYYNIFKNALLPSLIRSYYQDPLFTLWDIRAKRRAGLAIYESLAPEIASRITNRMKKQESEIFYFYIREITRCYPKIKLENVISTYIREKILQAPDAVFNRFVLYEIQALFKLGIPEKIYNELYAKSSEESFVEMAFYLSSLRTKAPESPLKK